MDNNKLKGVLVGILCSCFYILLMYNRTYLKLHSHFVIVFILNTIPNFLAGFLLQFLLSQIVFERLKKNKIIFSFLISGFYLTLEEYYPIFSHNVYFDVNDILMSWLGALISMLIVFKIKLSNAKRS